MATQLHLGGLMTWSLIRDEDSNREYKVTNQVLSDEDDGPYNVLNTTGLPTPGSTWNFKNDRDSWAWCLPNATVRPMVTNEKGRLWTVEQTFSTKPRKEKCFELTVEDPLLEPEKISGRFVKQLEEAHFCRLIQWRRNGVVLRSSTQSPIMNSAWEQFRGQVVEFEKNFSVVRIEKNVASLEWAFLNEMIDTVNDREMWGFPERCIKLSNIAFERRFYGDVTDAYTGTGTGYGPQTGTGTGVGIVHCNTYYVWILEFECKVMTDPDGTNLISGHDRVILDEGTKVLQGDWDAASGNYVVREIPGYTGLQNPDPLEPSHFDRFQDKKGNICRSILNGEGLPAQSNIATGTGTDNPTVESGLQGSVYVEKYLESNLFLLGIPTTLE